MSTFMVSLFPHKNYRESVSCLIYDIIYLYQLIMYILQTGRSVESHVHQLAIHVKKNFLREYKAALFKSPRIGHILLRQQ